MFLKYKDITRNIPEICVNVLRKLSVPYNTFLISEQLKRFPIKNNILSIKHLLSNYNVASLPVKITSDQLVNIDYLVILFFQETEESYFGVLINFNGLSIRYFVPHKGIVDQPVKELIGIWAGECLLVQKGGGQKTHEIDRLIEKIKSKTFLFYKVGKIHLNTIIQKKNEEERNYTEDEWGEIRQYFINSKQTVKRIPVNGFIKILLPEFDKLPKSPFPLEIILTLNPYDLKSHEIFNNILKFSKTHQIEFYLCFIGGLNDPVFLQFAIFVAGVNEIANARELSDAMIYWFSNKTKLFQKLRERFNPDLSGLNPIGYTLWKRWAMDNQLSVNYIIINNTILPNTISINDVFKVVERYQKW